MNTEPVLVIQGRIATISLCRPQAANRIGKTDLGALKQHIARVNATGEVVVLRILATGQHFCGGYDLVALGQDQGQGADEFGELVNELEQIRPISIVAVNGGVYGGATDLCLACDFRIGAPECQMQMPAVKLGLHLYKDGLERYVSRLGLNAAKRLLLTAEKIDSQTMLELGFLTEIVSLQQLRGRVDQLSALLEGMAPLPLLAVKKHLNRISRSALDVADLEKDIARAGNSADLREGIRAWKERRPPKFSGA